MTIFNELMQRVDDGESFHIDFEKRNMKIGKQFVIKDGKYDETKELGSKFTMDHILHVIEDLYKQYKYSLPSERSDNKRKKYFKALPVKQLTDKQLMTAVRREGAQARLEGFILCMILNESFVWDENAMGKWFWQSKNDPDLVILRSWIENKNN